MVMLMNMMMMITMKVGPCRDDLIDDHDDHDQDDGEDEDDDHYESRSR